ncbi:MAG: M24 family metallopeptidase [Candidatus Thorarchaeota archaeon]
MNKFEKVQEVLKDLNADGWLITCNEDSDIHSRYMLGVAAHARHYVYVARDGKHKVIAVAMETAMIERSLKRQGVEAEVKSYGTIEELQSLLKAVVNKPKIALNFSENNFSNASTAFADFLYVGDYNALKSLTPNTEYISAAPIIYNLRSVKSSDQLQDLRNVCKATLEILETIPDWAKKGMTEKEVKAKIEYEYMKLGKPSFEAIVGSGPNSADPHHNTSSKKISEGVLLIDTGMQIDEMCSDITWTFWVGNKPSKAFLKAYHALFEAKEIANRYYVDGTSSNVPAQKCREYLQNNGFPDHEKLFNHGLGHSLGFVAHDIGPRITVSAPNDSLLQENMIYTNEPGLYWKNEWGVRLEDDVIIGKEKCEVVTYNHKDPLLI